MTTRKFFRRTITLDLLSSHPFKDTECLGCIIDQLEGGGYSGKLEHGAPAELTGQEAVGVLAAPGDEPGFFGLDAEGEDCVGVAEEDPDYECQNCDYVAPYSELPKAKDILERMEPGDMFTDVECPACGALCFEVEYEEEDSLENDL